MVSRKSKSSTKQRLTDDSTLVEDDLERYLKKVMNENQINWKEKLEPIFTAIRAQPNNCYTNEDVSRKYEAFLQSVRQVMNNNNIFSMNVGYFVDPHSHNFGEYGYLELKSDGLFASHCDGTIKVENVLDVLSDLHAPEQILRNLIEQIIEEINRNKSRISELESCLESTEKAIKNLNIPSESESDNLISSDKNNLNYPKSRLKK